MKKNKMKRIIALALSFVLSFSLLACGSSKENQSDSPVKEQEGEYPAYLNLDGFKPIVKEGEEITLTMVVCRPDGVTTEVEDMWIYNYFKDVLNVNLDVTVWTSETIEEQKSLMLASAELPDIMISLGFSNSDIVQYGIEEEMFLPISDYFSEELTPNIMATLEEYPVIEDVYRVWGEDMYTLPQVNAVYPGRPGTTGNERFFIDTRYMDAIGMTELPETLDEVIDMLRAFKKLDPATMGVDEIYPVLSVDGLLDNYIKTALGWAGTSNVSPVWDEAEQEIVVPALTEKYGEYIKIMNTLYSEGLIHPDYFTMDATEIRALMAEGKCGVLCDYAPYLSTEDWDQYVAAYPVTSEWNDTPISVAESVIENGDMFISADTKYPELCVRIMDYIYSEEGSVYFERGPIAGTEDTLGLVEGLTLGEDGSLVSGDVTNGTYEDLYYYLINEVRFGNHYHCNMAYMELYSKELLGVEDPQLPVMDRTQPDPNYRMLIYDAQHEYLVDPLPSAYRTVEQNSKYADLQTAINDHLSAEKAKFIVGQRPLDELDQLLEELNQLSGEEYYDLCLEIYKGYSR